MIKTTQFKKPRAGFTIIEVILFVAISAFLIVGLMVGMTANIARQRYTDSVQDLADFLRIQFQAVSNPKIPDWTQGMLLDYPSPPDCNFEGIIGFLPDGSEIPTRPGTSSCQIMGRLVVFGDESTGDEQVDTYLVVGSDARAALVPTDNLIERFRNSDPFIPHANLSDRYLMQYGATPEVIAPSRDLLRAAILVIRPPASSAVRTLIYTSDSFRNFFNAWTAATSGNNDPSAIFSSGDFSFANFSITGELDICVGSDDIFAVSRRRNIRVKAGGTNASAVELISEGESICE